MDQIPETVKLPLLPLRGMIMFPHTVLHFDVGRTSSVAAVERAMLTDQLIFVATQKDIEVEEPGADDLYSVGTIARVRQVLHLPGNNLRVLAEGQRRATLVSLTREDEAWVAQVQPVADQQVDGTSPEITALVRMTLDYFEKYAEISNRISGELLRTVKGVTDPDELADMIAVNALTRWKTAVRCWKPSLSRSAWRRCACAWRGKSSWLLWRKPCRCASSPRLTKTRRTITCANN